MKRLLVGLMMLICGSAGAATFANVFTTNVNPIAPVVNGGTGSTYAVGALNNLGVSAPIQYLRTTPMTEYNTPNTPSFGFKTSPDGSNFTWLKIQSSFSDGTNGCYAPSLAFFNGNYIVTTDMGANTGPSNVFSITASSDLIHWTSAIHITNTLNPGGNIYGQELLVDNGNLFSYYGVQNAGGSGTNLYVIQAIDTADVPPTNWTVPVKVAHGEFGTNIIWDPSVIKFNGTYYMAYTDVGRKELHLATNSTSPTNAFTIQTVNILNANNPNTGMEGCNFCLLSNGVVRLYLMATTPNNIGKCYFTDTTDFNNWTPLSPIAETAPTSDHGQTIGLGTPAQQTQIQSLANVPLSGLQLQQEVYDILGTNGIATTPLLFPSGATISDVHYHVTGIELAQFSSVPETHPFILDVDIPVVVSGPLVAAQAFGIPRVNYLQRVCNEFSFSPIYTNGGVCLQIYSGPDFPSIQYHIRATVDAANYPLSSTIFGGFTLDGSEAYVPVDEGTLNGGTNGLYSVVNGLVIQPPQLVGNAFSGAPTPTVVLTNGSGNFSGTVASANSIVTNSLIVQGIITNSGTGVSITLNASSTIGVTGATYFTNNVFANSLILGNVTNTATGTLIQTNFISGKLYTNIYGRPISISANATLTTAGVSGNSSLALLASGYLTNYSGLSTIVTSIASSYTNVISIGIPPGQTYTFTNVSAGAGDSASVTGGQILVQ